MPTTDPVSQLIVGVTLVLLFGLLTLEKAHRVLLVLGAAALLWGITYLTPYRVAPFDRAAAHLDLNVLLLLAGMMALVGVLRDSGVFPWGVAHLLRLTGGAPAAVLAAIVWATALLSSMLDNVTTVVFMTPMATAMARALGLPPVRLLLPVVLASNIGGTATLIGDPPNIMIGSGAGLSFGAFLANIAGPVLVMLVLLEIGLQRRLGTAAVPRVVPPPIPPLENPVLLRWGGAIAGATLVGFLLQRMTGMPPAVVAVIGAALAMGAQDLLYLRTHRPSAHERQHGILRIFEHDIEWATLAFFACLFLVVGAAVDTGVIGRVADLLSAGIRDGSAALRLDGAGTLLFAALVLCWASGLLSAIVDNIPFVAVAIPIVHRLAADLTGDTTVLWWALALGACLGGNGSPVGASANVTVLGLAERDGVRIGFTEFLRTGVPVTVFTLGVASLYLAAFVHLGDRTAFGGAVVLAVALLLLRRPLLAAGRTA